MVRTNSFIAILVLISLLSCGVKQERKKEVSLDSVALAEIFSDTVLNSWTTSTRRNVAIQKEECDSLQIYSRLENFLEGFDIDESNVLKNNTLRATFLDYLSNSGVFPDSLNYNSIYIVESSISGERLYLLNSVAIVGDNKVRLYNFEHAGGEWRLQAKWESAGTKIENLFPKLHCSTTQCDIAIMDSNQSLIVSKFIPGEVESKVIIRTCKEFVQELNELFKLKLLGF